MNQNLLDRAKTLFDEKNLWAIFSHTRKFKISHYSSAFVIITAAVFASYGALNIHDSTSLSKSVGIISSLSFNFSATILGFLIAGFTIFATMTDKALFLKMLSKDENTYSMNYLKYIMVVFMDVFIQYIVLILINFIIITVTSLDNPFFVNPDINGYIYYSIFYIISSLTIISMTSLISFIYNVYQSICLTIFWYVSQNIP